MFLLLVSFDFGRLLFTVFAIAVAAMVLGWLLPAAYSLIERLLLRVILGPSTIHARLRRIAREDYALLAEEHELDRGLTKQVARAFAPVTRLFQLARLLRELRNLEREQAADLYRGLLIRIRYAWRDGLQTAVLLDYLDILRRLRAPTPELQLEGAIAVANLTYLLGDLHRGRALAVKNMEEAKTRDRGGIPKNQWRASYAYCNAQLFLGRFDDAAHDLGRRWADDYEKFDPSIREQLHDEFRFLLLDPIASVPRHLILASAFKGRAIITPDTWQSIHTLPSTLPEGERWFRGWYRAGVALCANTDIALHFTHAYAALYRTVVETESGEDDTLAILEKIPPTAPIVSLYAKHTMRGIHHFSGSHADDREGGSLQSALNDLRAADAYSRMSGNRFLAGILLPVYAAATARSGIYGRPETLRILARARRHARLAGSPFYDTLVTAAEAVLACEDGDRGRFERLRRRVDNYASQMMHGLVRVFHLEKEC